MGCFVVGNKRIMLSNKNADQQSFKIRRTFLQKAKMITGSLLKTLRRFFFATSPLH